MSENTLVCIIIATMIGGCVTCSVSEDWMEVQEIRLEHEHTIELLKAIPKP